MTHRQVTIKLCATHILVTLVLALVGGRGKESLVSLNKICSR
jgi:hypothetical protein